MYYLSLILCYLQIFKSALYFLFQLIYLDIKKVFYMVIQNSLFSNLKDKAIQRILNKRLANMAHKLFNKEKKMSIIIELSTK